MRALVLLALSLTGCSLGLESYTGIDDTDVAVDDTGIDDTGIDDTADTDTAVNEAPVADAGDDLTAMAGDIVDLDGSASFDPDGDTLTFAWVMTVRPPDSGSNLLGADDPLPRFYADVGGTFTLTLTVSDGEFESTDAVDVIALEPNDPPVADAGADQLVTQGDPVQLDGAASYDPEGNTITFQWQMTSRPSGSSAALADATTPYPRFTSDAAGEYNVQLVVNDGVQASTADAVRITASAQNDTGGDCGASCEAIVRQQLRNRLSLGDVASGPGLALLAVALFVGRRRL